jgi:hypothetical protein
VKEFDGRGWRGGSWLCHYDRPGRSKIFCMSFDDQVRGMCLTSLMMMCGSLEILVVELLDWRQIGSRFCYWVIILAGFWV